jgi:hypothetical protein
MAAALQETAKELTSLNLLPAIVVPAWPDLGLRWPSRLVATTAEDRLNFPAQRTGSLRQPAVAEQSRHISCYQPKGGAVLPTRASVSQKKLVVSAKWL